MVDNNPNECGVSKHTDNFSRVHQLTLTGVMLTFRSWSMWRWGYHVKSRNVWGYAGFGGHDSVFDPLGWSFIAIIHEFGHQD